MISSIEETDEVYTVDEFKSAVEAGGFHDWDGFGYAARDNLMDHTRLIRPSRVKEIPEDATHVVWFNK